MTIGEALAEARYRAGLTVDELSERTRIRETVIRCIEQDDYEACGGDLYVRGYVRAIAGAVGIDAQPLIRDYDAKRAAAAIATVPEPPTVIDMPPVAADPEFASADPGFALDDLEFAFDEAEFTAPAQETKATQTTTAAPATAASATAAKAVTTAKPVQPRQPSAWRARIRGRRWVTGVVILVVIALAVAGYASSRIVGHLRNHTTPGNAAAAVQQPKAVNKGTQGAGPKAPGAAGKPRAHAPPALPAHWLPIQQAMAFGPAGTADGDNPQGAQFAITSGSPSPWQTDWYASPAFGMLKSGTGLLLDMGQTVTITSTRIDLSPFRGADLQVRLGGTPSDLRAAAHADDVGGTVRLILASPQRARYVLIWFTLLPPDGAGTYQESVYRIVVNGRP